ncbi:hypothetical protein KC960_02445 [Candidatus Saccharibacteria bacterium]|nr:hypothetical protein [Candidatus Saccharibacteria bacterium]
MSETTLYETQPQIADQANSPLQDNAEQLAQNQFAIAELEQAAQEGIDTYKGKRHLEFRVGIEIEFGLQRPSDFRSDVVDNEKISDSLRDYNVGLVLNPDTIHSDDHDYTDLVGEFRSYAKGFLQRLKPEDKAEADFQERWLEQVDQLGPAEIVNFLIYEEFSKPKLRIPEISEDASLEDIDAFSDENGWIEWRFGRGTLQSGYYDNAGVSEIRLTPCNPSEALRRTAIIKQRMGEIGAELGAIVTTGAQMEHVNLSVYERQQDGSYNELIGNSESRADDTVDITSGIMEAKQEGIYIDAEMASKYDYMFAKGGSGNLNVGPTRKTLRVLDGRVELRGGFRNTEQAVAWVLAGTVDGLTNGAEALAIEGYEVSRYGEVIRVVRAEGFDKEADLQVQRMYENSEVDENGKFKINDGFAMIRGEAVTASLFGDDAEQCKAPDVLAMTVVSATRLDESGLPTVTPESLESALNELSDGLREKVTEYGFDDLSALADRFNERLAKVRVLKDKAVIGSTEHVGLGREETLRRMATSRVISLALGGNLEAYIASIDEASKDFQDRKVA